MLALTLAYAALEIVGGVLTGSLALLADAGHMLTDVASLGLALGALWMSNRPPTISHTYAYGRVEILVALVNGLLMWGVVAWIAVEALQRLGETAAVDAPMMLAIASGGLVVNAVAFGILHGRGGAAERSLNLRGAGVHVLGDLLGSVGAMTAAVPIPKISVIVPRSRSAMISLTSRRSSLTVIPRSGAMRITESRVTPGRMLPVSAGVRICVPYANAMFIAPTSSTYRRSAASSQSTCW